jgi:hypothetical protein
MGKISSFPLGVGQYWAFAVQYVDAVEQVWKKYVYICTTGEKTLFQGEAKVITI